MLEPGSVLALAPAARAGVRGPSSAHRHGRATTAATAYAKSSSGATPMKAPLMTSALYPTRPTDNRVHRHERQEDGVEKPIGHAVLLSESLRGSRVSAP